MAEELKTPVILRRWRDGSGIIALFPEIPAGAVVATGEDLIQSFEHVGQHGPASYPAVMSQSEPAPLTDPDVEELLDELRTRGYLPVVRHRRTWRMMRAARTATDEMDRAIRTGRWS